MTYFVIKIYRRISALRVTQNRQSSCSNLNCLPLLTLPWAIKIETGKQLTHTSYYLPLNQSKASPLSMQAHQLQE